MLVKLLFLSLTLDSQRQEQCSTPNGEPGLCKTISSCPVLESAFSNPNPGTKTYLANFLCPYKIDGEEEIAVCCPIFPNFNVYENVDKTIDNERSSQHHLPAPPRPTKTIVPTPSNDITTEESLIAMETSNVTDDIISQIEWVSEATTVTSTSERPSHTDDSHHPTISTEKQSSSDSHVTETDHTTTLSLDNNSNDCGKELKLRCGPNNTTEVSIHRWLGKLTATSRTGFKIIVCPAILISEVYALITSGCTYNILYNRWDYLFTIRFGDYQRNDNVSYENCNNITEDFEIEEVVPNRNKRHDVALLRLRRTASRITNIAPICLSTQTMAKKTLLLPQHNTSRGEQKYQTETDDGSSIESTVIPTYVSNAVTKSLSDMYDYPLMYYDDGKWYLEGLTSERGNTTYTKVSNFLSWIRETVRPWLNEQCTTPNGRPGECKLLRDCPTLQKAIANHRKVDEDYLRRFSCKNSSEIIQYCCGTEANFTVFDNKNENTPFMSNNKVKLPNLSYCGLQHRDDYISNDDTISIDEFPWVARIRTRNTRHHLCEGVLISDRYVLSTVSCNNLTLLNSSVVTLGEYHIQNETDCVYLSNIGEECSTVEYYDIEKLIAHPFYDVLTHLNDIVILRLNRKVRFSDYIRPICLPMPTIKLSSFGDTLFTSGFGLRSLNLIIEPTLKKKLTVISEPNNVCKKVLGSGTVAPNYELYTFCTTRNDSITLCVNDQGTPLMFSRRNQWFLEGILSVFTCEKATVQVHTRVSAYLDWIKEYIEP